MKQTSKGLSSTLFALLLLAAAAIAFFELVQPEYANLIMLKGQAASEQQLLANEQTLVAQAQKVLGNYQSQSSSTQAVNLAMPVGPNNAQAIAQLYGIATNSGLAIQTIGVSLQSVPQAAQSTVSANASSTVSASALVKPKGTITFQISASGNYLALKTFLTSIENNVRVFDVTGLSIRQMNSVTSGGVSQSATQDLYTFSITAVAYYQSS